MNFRAIVRDLRAELRADLHDLLYAYASRAGLSSPLGAAPPPAAAAEGSGAHPADGLGKSPCAVEPTQGVPRPYPMVQVRDLLGVIAGDKCLRVHDGSRCWDNPFLSPVDHRYWDRWCSCCLGKAALDLLTPDEVQR